MKPADHRLDWLLLGLMMLAWWLVLPWSAVHLDFSRDLAHAADILDRLDYPLSGPLLASWAQLGPIWYYLLAALLWISGDYLGVVLLLGLLGASQFILVYRAGCEWSGREAGLIWAALLLLPSWALYESFLVTHTLLTAPLVAWALLSGIRWARYGRLRDLLLLALTCSLALHAHPSTLGLLPLAALAAALGLRHQPPVWVWPLALLLALLPFLPMLIEQWQNGWSLLAGAREYRASPGGQGSLTALPGLLWQLTGGGLWHWLDRVLAWPRSLSAVLVGLNMVLMAAGLGGLVLRLREGQRTELWALLGLLMALVVLALLRAVYPYWFLSGVRVLLLGLVAVGLARLSTSARPLARLATGLAVLAVLAQLGLAGLTLALQRQATWPFAAFPTFDVIAPAQQHLPLPFLSVRATRPSGRWLCRHPDVAMHGALAQSLAMSYGLQRRLACGDGPVRLSGSAPGADHWAGLSLAMLRQLEVAPEHRWTGFGLVRVTPLWPAAEQIVPGQRPYPHLPLPETDPESLSLVLEPAPGRLVGVTHLGFMLSLRPEPMLYCDQTPVPAVAFDGLSSVFLMPDCDGPLRLALEVPDRSHVDIYRID